MIWNKEIASYIEANLDLKEKLLTQFVFTIDHEGKGLLNKEITKLYRSDGTVLNKSELTVLILTSVVIIENMLRLKKCSWTKHELRQQLENGLVFYTKNIGVVGQKFQYIHPAYVCPDGHIVRSQGELIIDMFLTLHGIAHEYDKKIYHKEGYVILMADFYLKDYHCYLEYWGMMDNENYSQKQRLKLKQYESIGKRVISIFPETLLDLNEILKQIDHNKKWH